MTDARFPVNWLTDRRLLKLSDAGFRLFANALMWSVSNMTDGLIEYGDIAMIPGYAPGLEAGLTEGGLWLAKPGAWLITVFDDTQTSAAEHEALARARNKNRLRQARFRERKCKGDDVSRNATSDVIDSVTDNVTRNADRDRYAASDPDFGKRDSNVRNLKGPGQRPRNGVSNATSNGTNNVSERVTSQDRTGSLLESAFVSSSSKDPVRKSGTSPGPDLLNETLRPVNGRPSMSITAMAGGCDDPPPKPPPDPGRISPEATTLVRELVRGHPAAVTTMLRLRASEMLNQGIDPEHVKRGLQIWLTKPHLGPNLLPSLVSEALRQDGAVPKSRVDQKLADLQNLGDRLTAQQCGSASSVLEIEGSSP